MPISAATAVLTFFLAGLVGFMASLPSGAFSFTPFGYWLGYWIGAFAFEAPQRWMCNIVIEEEEKYIRAPAIFFMILWPISLPILLAITPITAAFRFLMRSMWQ